MNWRIRDSGRWRAALLLGALWLLGGCASGQSELPDWNADAAQARMVYATATDESGRSTVAVRPPAPQLREGVEEAQVPAGGLSRGVVYRPSEPLLWARPYWATHWLYASPAARHHAGYAAGYSPNRDAFTALYYPWYGWSPRRAEVYPHPWNQAYGPVFRSWVYTPPFGDADGRNFVFPNPSAGIPISSRAYSGAYSRSGFPGATPSSVRKPSPGGISRLEDYAAPQTLRPMNFPAQGSQPRGVQGLSYPASRSVPPRSGSSSPTRATSPYRSPRP